MKNDEKKPNAFDALNELFSEEDAAEYYRLDITVPSQRVKKLFEDLEKDFESGLKPVEKKD